MAPKATTVWSGKVRGLAVPAGDRRPPPPDPSRGSAFAMTGDGSRLYE